MLYSAEYEAKIGISFERAKGLGEIMSKREGKRLSPCPPVPGLAALYSLIAMLCHRFVFLTAIRFMFVVGAAYICSGSNNKRKSPTRIIPSVRVVKDKWFFGGRREVFWWKTSNSLTEDIWSCGGDVTDGEAPILFSQSHKGCCQMNKMNKKLKDFLAVS